MDTEDRLLSLLASQVPSIIRGKQFSEYEGIIHSRAVIHYVLLLLLL